VADRTDVADPEQVEAMSLPPSSGLVASTSA